MVFGWWKGSAGKEESVEKVDDTRLSPYFPRAPAECKNEAETFFQCFSEKGKQPSEGEPDAELPANALKACLKDKQNYDRCMGKWANKKPIATYRVQEEYRLRGTQGAGGADPISSAA